MSKFYQSLTMILYHKETEIVKWFMPRKSIDVEGRWLRLFRPRPPFFLGWPQGHKKPPPEAPCQWNRGIKRIYISTKKVLTMHQLITIILNKRGRNLRRRLVECRKIKN